LFYDAVNTLEYNIADGRISGERDSRRL